MDFEQLKQTCLVCEKCDLCCTRTHVVFGTGNPNAEVLFIGEAPGRNEDEQGLPFVGRSGQLLDQYLKAIHLDREKNVFITNIVKCRPPENRDPLPNEWDACIPYLREQFRLIKPKIGRLPGAYRRAAHHPSGLQRHERARPVGGKERRLLHRHTPSRRAAPKPGQQAAELRRLCRHPRKNRSRVHPHL